MDRFEILYHKERVCFARQSKLIILVYALNSDGYFRYLTTLEGGSYDNYLAIKSTIQELTSKWFLHNHKLDKEPMLPSAFTEDWLYKDINYPKHKER